MANDQNEIQVEEKDSLKKGRNLTNKTKTKSTKSSSVKSAKSKKSANVIKSTKSKKSASKSKSKTKSKSGTKKTSRKKRGSKKAKTSSLKRYKKRLPQEKYFFLVTGEPIKNVYELIDMLETMPDEVFYHHVTPDRNDFYNWIKDVFDDLDLAEKLLQAKTPGEMREIMLKHVLELLKREL